jgi:hypothetical protein
MSNTHCIQAKNGLEHRGVCMVGSIAGWVHTKSSFNLSSGNSTDKGGLFGFVPEQQKSWFAG